MNNLELKEVLDRDIDSLNSDTVMTTKRQDSNITRYAIQIKDSNGDFAYDYSFRHNTNNPEELEWDFSIYYTILNDEYSYASSSNGFVYWALIEATIQTPLRNILAALTAECVSNYLLLFKEINETVKAALKGGSNGH